MTMGVRWRSDETSWWMISTILILATLVRSSEMSQDVFANDGESVRDRVAPSSGIEARDESDGSSIDDIGGKSKNSASINVPKNKIGKQPIILGTSKVAIVYSERKNEKTAEKEKNAKAPRVVYPQEQTPTTNDRNLRGAKVSPRDSYLDALEHSQTSKDPREGVISSGVKPKISKLIRREFSEGPVYRRPDEHYAPTKEPTRNVAGISYGGPTPEPFRPTPSHSYSLPVQSSSNFNSNDNAKDNLDFYGSPQVSYGPPTPQTQIYGAPSNTRNMIPSVAQNYYGPPNNGYPSPGIAHQAYGAPASTNYGAPFAIHQDFSQHLPSLMPSIDLSWPIALKLNAFTLAKILLKLVIFKMIVKFIALVCLLLFIPKLEITKKGDKNDDSEDSDDERRLFSENTALEQLNNLTAFVTSSIDKIDGKNEASGKSVDNCTSFGCLVKKLLIHDESWHAYARLFKSYIDDEADGDDDDRGVSNNGLDS